MTRLIPIALLVTFSVLVGGCGGRGALSVSNPFIESVTGGASAGPGSGLWGDTTWDPAGNHLGCIPARRYALAIGVHNNTKHDVTIAGVDGSQPLARVMERVAVQARLMPLLPKNNYLEVAGLGNWSPSATMPLVVPAGRDAWLQLNFLMRDCSLIDPHDSVTLNNSVRISYTANRKAGRQEIRTVPTILMRASHADAVRYHRHPYAG